MAVEVVEVISWAMKSWVEKDVLFPIGVEVDTSQKNILRGKDYWPRVGSR